MKDVSRNLSPRKTRALLALLARPTIQEAAKEAGIGPTTLYRFLAESEFQKAYHQAKKEAVGQALARLQQSSMEAVETLRQIMNDETKPTTARVTAARSILDMAIRAVEIQELEARIEELERRMRGRNA